MAPTASIPKRKRVLLGVLLIAVALLSPGTGGCVGTTGPICKATGDSCIGDLECCSLFCGPGLSGTEGVCRER